MRATLLICIYVLNLVDAGATHAFIALDRGQEANPIMRWAIEQGWWCFWSTKVVLVGAALWVLWKIRRSVDIYPVCIILFSIYALLCVWHIVGAFAHIFFAGVL